VEEFFLEYFFITDINIDNVIFFYPALINKKN